MINKIYFYKNLLTNPSFTKLILSFFMLIIFFPILDLYFAYEDDSCINKTNNILPISLKYYLLLNGLFHICSIIICFVINLDNITSFIDNYIISPLLFYCTFIWLFIDNSKCSNYLYYYIYFSLIGKIIYKLFVSNRISFNIYYHNL